MRRGDRQQPARPRPDDEQAVARAQPAAVERAQDARERLDERGALGVDLAADRQQLADEVGRDADALGEPAGVQAGRAELLAQRLVPAAAAPALAARRVVVDDDAVARRDAGHARADLLDLGAQLVAEDGGDLARDPAVEDVRAADAARQHARDDLAVAGARVGVVLDAHLAHADRARDPHRQASSAATLAAVGGAATPRSVTSAVTSPAGVTSKAGLRTAVPGRRDGDAAEREHLLGAALLDLDAVAVGQRGVDRRRPGRR